MRAPSPRFLITNYAYTQRCASISVYIRCPNRSNTIENNRVEPRTTVPVSVPNEVLDLSNVAIEETAAPQSNNSAVDDTDRNIITILSKTLESSKVDSNLHLKETIS